METIKIGIQWWKGSFNEIAIRDFLIKYPEKFWKDTEVTIVYLYTTEWVLIALDDHRIDFWVFAISNSIGWLVDETMDFLGRYRWKLVATHEIKIEHALMIHPESELSEIHTIMGHDQALKQCEKNLEKYFPEKEKIPGKVELTDNAAIASAVTSGKLDRSIGSIGHRSLAEIYGLKIAKENLQDRDDNRTTFCIVWR